MDKHGIAALLIGKPVGKPEGEDMEGESLSALRAHFKNAAHEMLKAIREDDADKLAEAFTAMHRLEHPIWDKEDGGEKEEDGPESEPEMEEGEEEEPEEE